MLRQQRVVALDVEARGVALVHLLEMRRPLPEMLPPLVRGADALILVARPNERVEDAAIRLASEADALSSYAGRLLRLAASFNIPAVVLGETLRPELRAGLGADMANAAGYLPAGAVAAVGLLSAHFVGNATFDVSVLGLSGAIAVARLIADLPQLALDSIRPDATMALWTAGTIGRLIGIDAMGLYASSGAGELALVLGEHIRSYDATRHVSLVMHSGAEDFDTVAYFALRAQHGPILRLERALAAVAFEQGPVATMAEMRTSDTRSLVGSAQVSGSFDSHGYTVTLFGLRRDREGQGG